MTLLSYLFAALITAAPQTPLHWEAYKDLILGGADHPTASFGAIGGLAVDGQQRVYVLDRMEKAVLVFSQGGELIRRFGRSGRGPGEFESPAAIGFLDDTLWVVDLALLRVTLFADSGEVLRTERVRYEPVEPYLFPLPPAALLKNGVAIAVSALRPRVLDDNPNLRTATVWIDRSGTVLDTLTLQDPHKGTLRIPSAGHMAFQPLGDNPLWAVEPGGEAVVVVARQVADAQNLPTFSVRRLLYDASVAFHREYEFTPTPVSDHLVDSLVDVAYSEIHQYRPGMRGLRESIRAALYTPRIHPPVRELLVGTDGTIWLRTDTIGAPEQLWLVLSKQGDIVAHMSLPSPQFRAMQANSRFIWGVEKDELDVQYVVRYRIGQPDH